MLGIQVSNHQRSAITKYIDFEYGHFWHNAKKERMSLKRIFLFVHEEAQTGLLDA